MVVVSLEDGGVADVGTRMSADNSGGGPSDRSVDDVITDGLLSAGMGNRGKAGVMVIDESTVGDGASKSINVAVGIVSDCANPGLLVTVSSWTVVGTVFGELPP